MSYNAYELLNGRAYTNIYFRLMGSLTNNGRKLANFTGFYKGIQSAGGAISPQLDVKTVSYMTEFIVNWALLVASLLIAAPVIWTKVQDTIDLEEDLKLSDEIQEDVQPFHDQKVAA